MRGSGSSERGSGSSEGEGEDEDGGGGEGGGADEGGGRDEGEDQPAPPPVIIDLKVRIPLFSHVMAQDTFPFSVGTTLNEGGYVSGFLLTDALNKCFLLHSSYDLWDFRANSESEFLSLEDPAFLLEPSAFLDPDALIQAHNCEVSFYFMSC